MTRLMLATGVAALAIAAPAAAGPHGGGGPPHGGGHANAQQHGGGHAQRAAQQQQHGGGHAQRMAQQQRGGGHAQRMAQHQQQRGGGHARPAQRMAQQHAPQQHGNAHAQRTAQVREHGNGHARDVLQAQRRENARAQQASRMQARQLGRNNNPVVAAQNAARVRALENDRTAMGYGVGGCPPGLAKKPVACMPPGQAKQLVNTPLDQARRLADLSRMPARLESIYPTTPNYYYTYGNGYAYRVNTADNVISALLPLFGAGYTVGQPFPSSYPYYALPAAYQPFYAASPYDYRYANGYVYQVNPMTGMIEAVDPMLGYGYGYGQMMPMTYSAYNVPYQYRPLYYDTADYYYRYAPGAIYQVDPTTSLITAVAALLAPNAMTVGQPLPVGYSAYNVPYAYRSTYYDTPTDWYRYSNGYVYRVDPATQLVTAIVAAALT